MYSYKDSILILINRFPILKAEYEDDKEYYEDIPYVFYESVFAKYIKDTVNKANVPLIIEIFKFVEDMLKYGDEEIINLISVAIVESLYYENKMKNKELMKKYFDILTLKSYNECR